MTEAEAIPPKADLLDEGLDPQAVVVEAIERRAMRASRKIGARADDLTDISFEGITNAKAADTGPQGAGETPARGRARQEYDDSGSAGSDGGGGGPGPAGAARAVDHTDIGDQYVIPGAEKKPVEPPKPSEKITTDVAQMPADEGLFGDDAKQSDLVDEARKLANLATTSR